MSSSNRRRLHRVCLAVIVLLYILSVPWYRESNEPLTIWLGMPDWVTVAVLCYVGVAIVNAAAWGLTDIPDIPDIPDESGHSGGIGLAGAPSAPHASGRATGSEAVR